jgi:hypothetical protein
MVGPSSAFIGEIVSREQQHGVHRIWVNTLHERDNLVPTEREAYVLTPGAVIAMSAPSPFG